MRLRRGDFHVALTLEINRRDMVPPSISHDLKQQTGPAAIPVNHQPHATITAEIHDTFSSWHADKLFHALSFFHVLKSWLDALSERRRASGTFEFFGLFLNLKLRVSFPQNRKYWNFKI